DRPLHHEVDVADRPGLADPLSPLLALVTMLQVIGVGVIDDEVGNVPLPSPSSGRRCSDVEPAEGIVDESLLLGFPCLLVAAPESGHDGIRRPRRITEPPLDGLGNLADVSVVSAPDHSLAIIVIEYLEKLDGPVLGYLDK